MLRTFVILLMCVVTQVAYSQQVSTVVLSARQSSSTVSFIHNGNGFGITMGGAHSPGLVQETPVQLEIYRGAKSIKHITTRYHTVTKENDIVIARASVIDGKIGFTIEDCWSLNNDRVLLSRSVSVTGTEEGAGFYSGIHLTTVQRVKWEDAKYYIPG